MTVFWEKVFANGKNTSSKIANSTTQETSHKLSSTDTSIVEPVSSNTLIEKLRTNITKDAAFFFGFEKGDTAITSHIISSGYHYSIRLPDEVEVAASGHHIIVRIIARITDNDQMEQSRFGIAYSTNEVGNSGWHWFHAESEWTIYTMEYDVPVMKNGNGDFIGILVGGKDQPSIELSCLSVTIS